jgi:thiamine biosynthesis lipoprotein ApbE
MTEKIDPDKLSHAAMLLNTSICQQIGAHEHEIAVITILAKNDGEKGGIFTALSANVEGHVAHHILERSLGDIETGKFAEVTIITPESNDN